MQYETTSVVDGSGMIYFRSGSSFEFSSSGSYQHYLGIFGNKKALNSNKKKNPSTTGIFHFLFHTTVLNYTYCTGSPEFKGLKLEIKFLSFCSFLFCWIRIGTLIPDLDKSSGSNRIRFHSTGNHIIEPNFLIQISNQHDADRNSANNFYRTVVVE